MGRWSQYDEDDHRLPEGMRRVGYDADTRTYTYQDENGTYWEGPEGARYGTLRRVGSTSQDGPTTTESTVTHFETITPTSLTRAKNSDWRLFAPFLLLVTLVLLLVFRFLSTSTSELPRPELDCEHVHIIKKGDTCWAIAKEYGMALAELLRRNEGLECDKLRVGSGVCVA